MSIVAYGYAIVPVGGAPGTVTVQAIAVEVESVELSVVLEGAEIQAEVP